MTNDDTTGQCPNDTNGDGNCGRPTCGACHPEHQPEHQPEPQSANELQLRRLLAMAFAGPHLYGDDGELQDNREQPFIDFRRDSPEELGRKMTQRHMRPGEGTLVPSELEKLNFARFTSSTVNKILSQNGSLLDCVLALMTVISEQTARIIQLEGIAPRKIVGPDGKTYIWHCPADLVPEVRI